MQKKENILGEAEEAPGEKRLDLGRRQSPSVYSYYRPGQDDASPERTTRVLQQLELSCFYCHESGCDPAAPSGSQGPDGTHLHQPCGKVGRKGTLDETEDDAMEEESV
jgi:hypothetical protein